MRVISKKTLTNFGSNHPDAQSALESWYQEAEKASWKEPAEIKEQYRSASILKDSRIVFNICGNKYRLTVKVNFKFSIVYIRFIGTHKEYDALDMEAI